jgi:hypothetical protein
MLATADENDLVNVLRTWIAPSEKETANRKFAKRRQDGGAPGITPSAATKPKPDSTRHPQLRHR